VSAEIRDVSGEELAETSWPLTHYAFGASPLPAATRAEWAERARQERDSRTLVAFVDGKPVATALGLRLKQNVRGRIVEALGVAGVAAHPDARRGGHVRAILAELHRGARDSGQAVSALYPFRPSFYAQFGYTGLMKTRNVRMYPAGMEALRKLDLDATVTLHETTDTEAWAAYLAVEDAWIAKRHGVMLDVSDSVRTGSGSESPMMLALVHRGDRVVGAMPFDTQGFGQELRGRRFLIDDPAGRLALLRWLGNHADQFNTYDLAMPPGEYPEVWYTDVAYDDETISKVPTHGAPMARVIDITALSGAEVGDGRVVVDVSGDGDVAAGRWQLTGDGGVLTVEPSTAGAQATLTVAGISALIYGSQSTTELSIRALASFEPAAADTLDTMFDRRISYVHKAF
jgi:predicted acetyltransferase